MSWHSSSCHLFSISGIKTRLKEQDVGCRQLPSFWTRLSAITCLSSCWRNLWRYPCFLSISPIPPVSSTFPLLQPVSSVISPDGKIEQSYETPTLPWLLLFFSFCHFASNHHLEIYPTIKSFSRNLAPRSWNARRSRSGWAVRSQSWSVSALLFLQSVICHVLGRQMQHRRRQLKASSMLSRHHRQQEQQQCK